ncbi:MAG: 16S rRNA (adenine(1518)-N(6)/adenine(1519)-N(6))-dimethyltransferase [Candidatus Pacebacteria bacterium]|nr:16S rRNA (adenine(1518)-N(6)/adenine(1519)-N(6))-dimethyltransferase [Candidatus Paceibacterota bacterium]
MLSKLDKNSSGGFEKGFKKIEPTSKLESDSHFAKKSLGQNFLKSERALLDMVQAGDIQEDETIIEIGPGKGALTIKLLEKIKNTPGSRLICIEKDDRLVPFLKESYAEAIQKGILEIIHGDIIDILENKDDFEKLVDRGDKGGKKKPYKIIANIPYYITGLIFRGIFELHHLPEKIVLLVQKEVANRIIAYGDNGKINAINKDSNGGNKDSGKESILSISIKLYGVPRRVSIVPRGAFVPAPNVDSAIIAVENIERKIPQKLDSVFFEMIHSAFSHKRKRLAKNLESFSNKKMNSIQYEKILGELDLDKNIRAEDISIQTYIQLFERLI